MLETIGISKLKTDIEISKKLKFIFPKLDFQYVKFETIKTFKSKRNQVGFTMLRTESEFPLRIEIWFSQTKYTEEREQFIAKGLSKLLNCKTIVGYQENQMANPFLSLIFDCKNVYLAEDSETKYFEEGSKEIKIIKEIKLKNNFQFDEFGNRPK